MKVPNPDGRADRGSLRTRHAGWLAPGDLSIMVVGSLVVLLVLAGFWVVATRLSPDTWVPILVIVGALVVTVPICFLVTRRPHDRRLRRLLILALVLKLFASFLRYYVNEVSYGGEADSGQYHIAGQIFIENLHHGDWSLDTAPLDTLSDETRLVGYITGVLYLVVGPTYMGGFLVYSWICWLGLLMFFQAFRTAYPNAPPYLAAKLLFFLPSMLYWPSSIGKDALMVFALGMLTYGMARFLATRHRLVGVACIVPASVIVLSIRPHLLLVALVGLCASLVARNAAGTKALAAVVTRVVVLLLLVPLLIVGLGRMDSLFGSTGGSVTEALDQTSRQTSVGGSSFETRPVTNPVDLPVSTISVLYRPFPFEASGIALVSSLEGTLLLALTLVAARWIWRIGPTVYHDQFAAYCGGYVLAFVFAFSNVGNAGILARQRVQLFPVLMILVAAAREQHRVHLESNVPEATPTGAAHGVLAPV